MVAVEPMNMPRPSVKPTAAPDADSDLSSWATEIQVDATSRLQSTGAKLAELGRQEQALRQQLREEQAAAANVHIGWAQALEAGAADAGNQVELSEWNTMAANVATTRLASALAQHQPVQAAMTQQLQGFGYCECPKTTPALPPRTVCPGNQCDRWSQASWDTSSKNKFCCGICRARPEGTDCSWLGHNKYCNHHERYCQLPIEGRERLAAMQWGSSASSSNTGVANWH